MVASPLPAFLLDVTTGPGIEVSREGAATRIDIVAEALSTGGVGNVFRVDTGGRLKSLRGGVGLLIQADRTNTGPATLVVDGYERPWLDAGGNPQIANRIVEGRFYQLLFDGGTEAWRVQAGASTLDEIPGLVEAEASAVTAAEMAAAKALEVAGNAATVSIAAEAVALARVEVAGRADAVATDRATVAQARADTQAARDQAQNAVATGRVTRDTYDDVGGVAGSGLVSSLNYPDGAQGEVLTGTGVGLYLKSGPSGSGSWAKKLQATVPSLDARQTVTENLVQDLDASEYTHAFGDEDFAVIGGFTKDGGFRAGGAKLARVNGGSKLVGDDGPVDLGGNYPAADITVPGVGLAIYDQDGSYVPVCDESGRPLRASLELPAALTARDAAMEVALSRMLRTIDPSLVAAFRKLVEAGASTADPDAEALLARFTVSPSERVRALIRVAIRELKAIGVWSKLDALYVTAMPTAQGAALNWIAPRYDLTGNELFSPGLGFSGFNTSNTNFNPSLNASGQRYAQNSAFLGVFALTDSNENLDLIGNPAALIRPYVASGRMAVRLNSAATVTTPFVTKTGFGFTWASRQNAAGFRYGRDDRALGTADSASIPPGNGSFRVGGGTIASNSPDLVACAMIGAGLSDAEAASVYGVIAPLLAELVAPIPYALDATTVYQTLDGIGFELQTDSIKGDTGGIQESDTSNILLDLTPSERTRLANFSKGMADFRLAMGLYYRGVSADGKHFVESPRMPGLNAAIRQFIAESGVPGIAYLHWSPAPYWKKVVIDGVTYRGSQATAPDRVADPVGWNDYLRRYLQGGTLDHPDKAADPTGYAAWMEAFASAVLVDMEYVHLNVGPIVKFSPQNEPATGSLGPSGYPTCIWNNDQMYDFLKVMVPKIRGSTVLSTYGGQANTVAIYVDSDYGQTGKGAALIKADPALLAEIYGWAWHLIQATSRNAGYVRDTVAMLTGGAAGKPVFCDENEYFDPSLDPASPSYLEPDYRFANTFLMPMYWFVFVGSPIWYWIHLGKPSTGPVLETQGRALTIWRPPGSPARADYPNLAEGAFEPVAVNWNALLPWVRHMPKGSRRVALSTPHMRHDALAMAWIKPDGKLVIAVGNRGSAPYAMTLVGTLSGQFTGLRYSLAATDVPLGARVFTADDPLIVPAFCAEIWTQA